MVFTAFKSLSHSIIIMFYYYRKSFLISIFYMQIPYCMVCANWDIADEAFQIHLHHVSYMFITLHAYLNKLLKYIQRNRLSGLECHRHLSLSVLSIFNFLLWNIKCSLPTCDFVSIRNGIYEQTVIIEFLNSFLFIFLFVSISELNSQ